MDVLPSASSCKSCGKRGIDPLMKLWKDTGTTEVRSFFAPLIRFIILWLFFSGSWWNPWPCNGDQNRHNQASEYKLAAIIEKSDMLPLLPLLQGYRCFAAHKIIPVAHYEEGMWQFPPNLFLLPYGGQIFFPMLTITPASVYTILKYIYNHQQDQISHHIGCCNNNPMMLWFLYSTYKW